MYSPVLVLGVFFKNVEACAVNKKQRHIVHIHRGSLRPCTFALS
jgi:hypothetical protein